MSKMKLSLYVQKLVMNTLRFGDVCKEYNFKKIFIKALDVLICRSICEYQRSTKNANYPELMIHATSPIVIMKSPNRPAGQGQNLETDLESLVPFKSQAWMRFWANTLQASLIQQGTSRGHQCRIGR